MAVMSEQSSSSTTAHRYRIAKRRAWTPIVVAVVAVLGLVGVVQVLATNPNLSWPVVAEYLFAPQILRGVVRTVQLSIVAMIIAIVLGVVVGLGRMSRNAVLSSIAGIYVLVFRSVPLLVQLLLWGNVGLLLRSVTLGIPFTDVAFFSIATNELISPFTAAIVGLSLHGAAYMGEIVRAGIASVDKGQSEAAAAMGMSSTTITRKIVLPQAMRVIIPPTGNQFVDMIKGTSLVSVISGGDLLTQAQNISAMSYRVIEMLFVASFWYMALIGLASIGQFYLERRVSKGFSR